MGLSRSEELTRLVELRDKGALTPAEFESEKRKLLSADVGGPASSTKLKKSGGTWKWVLGGLTLLVVGSALTSKGDKSKDSEPISSAAAPSEQPLNVTARELFAAFEANQVSAHARYSGRKLLVRGVVSGVKLDFSNEPIVLLETSNQFLSAQATLSGADKAAAAKLGKGQPVTLLCGSVDTVIGAPMLSDCALR